MRIRILRPGDVAVLLLALLCCGPAGTATAQVYKWVDEHGVTHYDEHPPQNGNAKTIDAKPAAAPAPGASQAKPPDGGDWQEKDLEFRRRRIEREQKAEREQQEAQEKRKRCNISRDDLQQMESVERLYDLNDKGERIFLDDAQRKAAIEQARRRVEKYCS